MPRENWKRKYEETAGLLKLQRDATELMRIKWQAAEEELVILKENRNRQLCPRSMWYENIDIKWIVIVALALGFSFAMNFFIWKYPVPEVPKETIRYVRETSAVYRDCQQSWKIDEREIRKLKKEIQNENTAR